MKCVAEVRRNLRCSNVYIQHEETINFKISLKKNEIMVKNNGAGKQSISLNHGFEVDIKSLSSLVVEKENTSFRINIIPSIEAPCLENTQPTVILSAPVEENQPIQMKCVTCKTNLLENETITFSRVLEYPSGSLDVSEFFCHNGPDLSSKLTPKTTDLFYGFQFLVINLEILSNSKEKDEHFYCKRCLSYLGQRLQENAVKIWFDNVRIDSEGTATPRINKRLLVEKLFHKIVSECNVNEDIIPHCLQFSKVVLETVLPTRQKRFLMVHVLEKNLEIMKSSDVASAFDLMSQSAYKVLFKSEKDEENPLLVFWKNDLYVHNIPISYKLFEIVLKVLVEGNLIFPSIYRLSKDFRTSFIFYSS